MKCAGYYVGGKFYKTQKALNDEISFALRSVEKNILFYNDFFKNIVNELHPDSLQHNQKSNGNFYYLDTKGQAAKGILRKETKGQNIVITFFEPINRWMPVTLFPHKYQSKNIVTQDFIAALRKKSVHFLPEKNKSTRCSIDGCSNKQLEYHHCTPTFKEMAQEALQLFTSAELDSKFGYCKFNPEETDSLDKCIPNDHPAVMKLKELHQTNQFMWLCKKHHADITYKRNKITNQ